MVKTEIEPDEKIGEDAEEVEEMKPPLGELRKMVEDEEERQNTLDLILEKTSAYTKFKEDQKEHARLAALHAIQAKQNEIKSEQAFYAIGDQYYDMLCKTYYVRSNPDEKGSNPNFIVSTQTSSTVGEMMVYASEGRLVIRPATHAHYSLSMPLIGTNCAEKKTKQSRKGGPQKNVNGLKVGISNAAHFEIGKTTMKNVRGRQIKTPFKPPEKISTKHALKKPLPNGVFDSDDEDLILYRAKKKKIAVVEPVKLMRSGRDKNARTHPKKR